MIASRLVGRVAPILALGVGGVLIGCSSPTAASHSTTTQLLLRHDMTVVAAAAARHDVAATSAALSTLTSDVAKATDLNAGMRSQILSSAAKVQADLQASASPTPTTPPPSSASKVAPVAVTTHAAPPMPSHPAPVPAPVKHPGKGHGKGHGGDG